MQGKRTCAGGGWAWAWAEAKRKKRRTRNETRVSNDGYDRCEGGVAGCDERIAYAARTASPSVRRSGMSRGSGGWSAAADPMNSEGFVAGRWDAGDAGDAAGGRKGREGRASGG